MSSFESISVRSIESFCSSRVKEYNELASLLFTKMEARLKISSQAKLNDFKKFTAFQVNQKLQVNKTIYERNRAVFDTLIARNEEIVKNYVISQNNNLLQLLTLEIEEIRNALKEIKNSFLEEARQHILGIANHSLQNTPMTAEMLSNVLLDPEVEIVDDLTSQQKFFRDTFVKFANVFSFKLLLISDEAFNTHLINNSLKKLTLQEKEKPLTSKKAIHAKLKADTLDRDEIEKTLETTIEEKIKEKLKNSKNQKSQPTGKNKKKNKKRVTFKLPSAKKEKEGVEKTTTPSNMKSQSHTTPRPGLKRKRIPSENGSKQIKK